MLTIKYLSPGAVHQQECLQGAESAVLMTSHLTGSALGSRTGRNENTQRCHQHEASVVSLTPTPALIHTPKKKKKKNSLKSTLSLYNV